MEAVVQLLEAYDQGGRGDLVSRVAEWDMALAPVLDRPEMKQWRDQLDAHALVSLAELQSAWPPNAFPDPLRRFLDLLEEAPDRMNAGRRVWYAVLRIRRLCSDAEARREVIDDSFTTIDAAHEFDARHLASWVDAAVSNGLGIPSTDRLCSSSTTLLALGRALDSARKRCEHRLNRDARVKAGRVPLSSLSHRLGCDSPHDDPDMIRALHESLAEVPQEKREMLLARRVDGQKLKEIGQRVGLTESRVSIICAEALGVLAAEMEKRGFGPPEA